MGKNPLLKGVAATSHMYFQCVTTVAETAKSCCIWSLAGPGISLTILIFLRTAILMNYKLFLFSNAPEPCKE